MAEEEKRWNRRRSATLIVPIWFIGWLFTIGYAGLVWWQIILAIIVWPYFLGRALGG
jgi:hypothetical protein